MRTIRILFGLLFAAAGSYLVFAAHQKYDSASEPIRGALLKQSSALVTVVDQAFFAAEQRSQEIVLRHMRKDPATATVLSHWDSPRVILSGDEKIKAADFLLDAPLLGALEAHRRSENQHALYSRNGTQFVLVRGEVQGKAYAAAFLNDALFSGLGVGEAMRVWVASSSGNLLYHSVKRLIGSQVANLRPIASGAEMISHSEAKNLVSTYTGFEGGNTLGAWSVIPKRNLIIGTEWSGRIGPDATLDVPFFIGAILIALGFFLLGMVIRRRNKKITERFKFDPARLDDDVIEYLEENQKATEAAVDYARSKDGKIKQLEEQVYTLSAAQNELEWRLSCYESLMETAAGVASHKQVLRGLTDVIAKRVLGAPIVQYRFSSTSYSLVPEYLAGGGHLSDEARQFLSEARIFIGNFRAVHTLKELPLFQKWNEKRLGYMGVDAEPLILPLEGGAGTSGAMLILLPKGANDHGELNDAISFFHSLIKSAVWLCDTKRHLLQSSNAKPSSWSAMASSSDSTRGAAPEANA